MGASGRDPDALWRPGYDGPWHVPAPDADPTSPRGGRRGPTTRELAISALLGLIVVGALVLLLGRDRPADPLDPSQPGSADRPSVEPVDPWSATFATIRIGALTATDDELVVLVDRPGSVVALDRRDGGVLWTGSAPGTSATGLDVVDGVVLARHVEADGLGSVVAHDLVGGVPLWREVLAVGERIDVIDGTVWRSGPGNGQAVPIEARSGSSRELADEQAGATTDDPGAAPRPLGAPTDHVLRGMAPGSEMVIVIPGATVRVVVDQIAVTLVHQRSDDPTPGPSASVP